MKRLLFFLTSLALVLSVQGRAVFFYNNIVEFKPGTEPQTQNGYKYYHQDVWWTWSEGDTPLNLSAVHLVGEEEGVTHDFQDLDFDWSVEVIEGDLTIPNNYYDRKVGQNLYLLKNGEDYGSHIYFTGTKGILKVTATNPDFDGMPYSCSYEIRYHLDVKSKKWDFYSRAYTVQGDGWEGETTIGSGTKVHWYNNSNNYFNSNNAAKDWFNGSTFIAEAGGLYFKGGKDCVGGNNPSGSAPVEDRYVVLKKGAQLSIPHATWEGYTKPRIKIKMGRYGSSTLNLIFYNGRDALGKLINDDYNQTKNQPYGIGGSDWWGSKGDNNQRGEYHFQIKETSNDFIITVGDKDNVWSDCLLLYSVEVYDSDEMITENSVLGDRYQFLHSALNNTDSEISGKFYLHYRGKGESSRISQFSTTGTVGTTDESTGEYLIKRFGNTNESSGAIPVHTFISKEGEYGTFRMRIEIWDHHKNYCTDYAYRTQSVGYMEKKEYPYTWDFTDVYTYWSSNDMEVENGDGYATQQGNDYFYGKTNIPRNVWEVSSTKKWSNASVEKSGYGLKVAHDAGHNVLFCGGSQLWRGTSIIPETAGLAFEPVNYDATYNSALIFTAGGLTSLNDVRDWWLWRITVPEVTTQDVIYIRAKKLVNNSYYNVGFVYGEATNKTEKKAFGTEGSVQINPANEVNILSGNEVVYAIPSPSKTESVTLFFSGVEIQKIAVSRDGKTVNQYGWATESRERVIDPELTSYMTGYDFESCAVNSVSVGNGEVVLQRIPQGKVMKKSNGNDYNAYIIHNKNNQPVEILDVEENKKGFHLFVPDMHDYVKENEGNGNIKSTYGHSNTLKAVLSKDTKIEQTEGDYTNFVLTYQYKDVKDGQTTNENPDFGKVGFFMVQPEGVYSKGHQGYLPINMSSSNNANGFNLVYLDETEGIELPTQVRQAVKDNVYYNLNGQKLNGVPSKGGIYIVNGKKVIIK